MYAPLASETNEATQKTKIATWHQSRLDINMRGTGCFLTTAIACAFASGYDLKDAITLANAKMNEHFKNPETTATHWPKKLACYPFVKRANLEKFSANTTESSVTHMDTSRFLPMHKQTGLYPIVDSADWIERLANTGVHTIQLRIKNADPTVIENEIAKAVAIANNITYSFL